MSLATGRFRPDDDDFIVGPGLREHDFLESSIGSKATELVRNGDHTSYLSPPCKIDGRGFLMKLFFTQSVLTAVSLSPLEPRPRTFQAIDEMQLEALKRVNDEWLRSKGVRPSSEFRWGNIDSVIDLKSWAADITLRFKRSAP